MINKGNYLLILFLEKEKVIQIGKLGKFAFQKGWYCYVGSAMNNLQARVERHLRIEKKQHWHIDYLRSNAYAVEVIRVESERNIECELNEWITAIAELTPIRKFGSSDCLCFSHLHFFKERPVSNLQEILNRYFPRLIIS